MTEAEKEIHSFLIRNQSIDELRRKADKALCRKSKLWTQEDIDLIDREASELADAIGWGTSALTSSAEGKDGAP